MVTTRSKNHSRLINGQERSIQDEEGTSNDPQITITLLNDKISQMAKSITDLADINATLQARLPELFRTEPENKEGRNSHTGGQRKEEEHLSQNQEGSGERTDHRDADPENARHWKEKKEKEEKLKNMIVKLEQ
jgi:hypothetical protein